MRGLQLLQSSRSTACPQPLMRRRQSMPAKHTCKQCNLKRRRESSKRHAKKRRGWRSQNAAAAAIVSACSSSAAISLQPAHPTRCHLCFVIRFLACCLCSNSYSELTRSLITRCSLVRSTQPIRPSERLSAAALHADSACLLPAHSDCSIAACRVKPAGPQLRLADRSDCDQRSKATRGSSSHRQRPHHSRSRTAPLLQR